MASGDEGCGFSPFAFAVDLVLAVALLIVGADLPHRKSPTTFFRAQQQGGTGSVPPCCASTLLCLSIRWPR
jgi:hypothetical protein